MKYFSRSEVLALLSDPADLISTLTTAIKDEGPDPDTNSLTVSWAGSQGMSTVVAGASKSCGLVTAKLVSRAQDSGMSPGLLMAIDEGTGVPRGVTDGGIVTELRTAAVVALAVQAFASHASAVITVIGTGGIAARCARWILPMRPWREVRLVGRDIARTQMAARELARSSSTPIRAESSLESAVRAADVVIDGAALERHTPSIRGGWFGSNTLIVAYGAYSHFADDASDGAVRVITDRWVEPHVSRTGAFQPHAEAGRLRRDQITPLWAALDERGTGRQIFWLRGLALYDAALLRLLFERATVAAGTDLPYPG